MKLRWNIKASEETLHLVQAARWRIAKQLSATMGVGGVQGHDGEELVD